MGGAASAGKSNGSLEGTNGGADIGASNELSSVFQQPQHHQSDADCPVVPEVVQKEREPKVNATLGATEKPKLASPPENSELRLVLQEFKDLSEQLKVATSVLNLQMTSSIEKRYIYRGTGLYKMLLDAAAVKPVFDGICQRMCKYLSDKLKVSFTYISVPVKSYERAATKVAVDYDGDVCRLKDALRGTVVLHQKVDAEGVRLVYNALKMLLLSDESNTLLGDATPLKFSDRYQSPLGDYKDWKFVFDVCQWPCELQFNLEEAIERKNGEQHAAYELSRLATGNLLAASMQGDYNMVCLMLELRADVEQADAHSCTPLHYAALYGNAKLVAASLRARANVLAIDVAGTLPLHRATILENSEAASLIIAEMQNQPEEIQVTRREAKESLLRTWNFLINSIAREHNDALVDLTQKVEYLLDFAVPDIQSQLHLVAASGLFAACSKLLDSRAEPNDNFFRSDLGSEGLFCWALDVAVLNSHYDVALLLCDHGAELFSSDKAYRDGPHELPQSAAEGYVRNNNVDSLQVLLGINQKRPLHKGRAWGEAQGTPLDRKALLKLSLVERKLTIIKCLIEMGERIEDEDVNAGATLREAAGQGNEKLVRSLLDAHAPVDSADLGQHTPLFFAASAGDPSLCTLLIEAKANVNHVSRSGYTASHIASLHGSLEFLEELYANDADLEKANEEGKTALHIAAERGYVKIANQLIGLGLDSSSKDAQGYSARDYLERRGESARTQNDLQNTGNLSRNLSRSTSAASVYKLPNKTRKELLKYSRQIKVIVHNSTQSAGQVQDFIYNGAGLKKLLCDARKIKPHFDDLCAALCVQFKDNLGVTFTYDQASVKQLQRAMTKVAVMYNGDPCQLLDVVRGRMVLGDIYGTDAMKQLYEAIICLLDKNTAVGKELYSRNVQKEKFIDAYFTKEESPIWYLYLRISNFICELEFRCDVPPELSHAVSQSNSSQRASDCKRLDYLAADNFLAAAMQGDYDAVCLMIRARANVNTADAQNCTALHYSALHGHTELCQVLLDERANVFSVDDSSSLVLERALQNGNIETARTILDVMVKEPGRVRVLPSRAKEALLTCWNLAVKRNSSDYMALEIPNHIADVLANLLSDAGLDLDDRLHLAAASGKRVACRALLKARANPNSYRLRVDMGADIQEYSTLDIAVWKGWTGIAKILLRNGGDSAELFSHSKEYHIGPHEFPQKAAQEYIKKREVTSLQVMLLIDTEAPRHKSRPWGESESTPLDRASLLAQALDSRCLEVVKCLVEQYGLRFNEGNHEAGAALREATGKGDTKLVRLLLRSEAAVDAQDSGGRTPLFFAVRDGSPSMCSYLLERHANVHHVVASGRNAVHFAAQIGSAELVELLYTRKIDLEKVDQEGKCAIHIAARKGFVKVLEQLVTYGVNVNRKDGQGLTPMQCAPGGPSGRAVKDFLKRLNDRATGLRLKV